jgi:hypothetical protein
MKLRTIVSVHSRNFDTRIWGVFTQESEDIEKIILSSGDSFIEHYYDYIVLEEFDSDRCIVICEQVAWFAPIYENEQLVSIKKIDKPDFANETVNFGIC